jgi:hypothetical protein
LTVDFESFNNVLKHPIRRKVILALGANKNLSYVELLNITEAANTGKFNYHLKILGDLIEKSSDGKYCLTEKGTLALQFLQKFPEKKPVSTSNLHMADAALIGFAGVFLVAADPILWIGLWLGLNQITLSESVLNLFGFGLLLYSLFVPGVVMWFLAVRRSHSQDMYNLLRAPLVESLVLLAVLAVLFLTGYANVFVAELKSPMVTVAQGAGWSHTTQQITVVSLAASLLQGLVFSFLGVAIIELLSRLRKRLKRD